MAESSSQTSKLIRQLSRDSLECMICCNKVRRNQPIWSCEVCYNIFHLPCIGKWASSSIDDNGWRCPGCQNYSVEIPNTYRCFCGKTKNPYYYSNNRYNEVFPHACNKPCGRLGNGGADCNHGCQNICHPGKCDPCPAIVTRYCGCGRQSFRVVCSSKTALHCGATCYKLLNCELHCCEKKCHEQDCEPCNVTLKLDCYCGKNSKVELCTVETRNKHNYTCGGKCDKLLTCNQHHCSEICHPFCKPCQFSRSMVMSCPCGQTPIDDACKINGMPPRKSCLDPIPTCGKKCLKMLKCGPPGNRHKCQSSCHAGDCPSCPLITSVKCRCGNKDYEIPCPELEARGEVLCEKKCTKKRSCGKHKCNNKCCIILEHICPIVCNRPLSCGSHNCDRLCHNSYCPPCSVASFEELTCQCGSAVIYPPVLCGTKVPECSKTCSRQHDCDHPVHHTCHQDAECPPCFVLTTRECHGKHMRRQNIPCHVKEVSCGLPCMKTLSCGLHKCLKKCHAGECMLRDEVCKLPCQVPRKNCGHCCNAPCHPNSECPETKCKEMVEIICMCGRIKDTIICWKREAEYDRVIFQAVLQKIEQLKIENKERKQQEQESKEVDEEQIKLELKSSRNVSQLLKCDKECSRIERNKKLAEALQLENPDVCTSLGTPNYSDYMIAMAKKNPRFCERVHDQLTALVVKAKTMSKQKNSVGQKNWTFQFEGLNRDCRQLIYEYCEHFGCLYNSIDEGEVGLKSSIITASRDKWKLPSTSLVQAVFQTKTVKAERKSAYADVELLSTKSTILKPGNLTNLKRLETPNSSSGGSWRNGMVSLKNPES